jgi:predicted transcriptional regulator
MSEEFAKLLKLSDEQKKEFEQKQQELQKKLQEEIRDLRRKRQRELVEAVLTKEQLAKLKELIGDDLAPDEKQDKKQRD